MRAKKWITNNITFKILSLLLAIATWFYINMELTKIKTEEERSIFSMLHYDVISKTLPVQVTIVGEAREGYEIITDGITIDPKTCVVIGPKNILEDVEIARTVPIDINEYTQDVNKDVALAPIAKGIELKNYFVSVHIPIVKKGEAGKSKKLKLQ